LLDRFGSVPNLAVLDPLSVGWHTEPDQKAENSEPDHKLN
jgi:hypothetical protein